MSKVEHNNHIIFEFGQKNSTNWHNNMFLVHNLAIKNLSGFKEVTTYTNHKWIHL
jgi:hypothetical protein